MSKKIHFDLVSPEKKLVSEDVRMAVIPGDEGTFGVMAGHCSLVASLGTGVIKLYKEDEKGTPERIFIMGGFADVTPDKCSVLAEEAIPVSSMDKGRLEQQLRDLNEDLGLAKEKEDKARVKKQIGIVNAKILAVSGQ